jgi:hypothetical protein
MRSSRTDPIRQFSFVIGKQRERLKETCERLDEELRDLDRQLGVLAQRRRAVAAERLRLHRILWPVIHKKRGRQPRPDGGVALPALPANATWLYGRRLRGVCLAILGARGPLPLTELHAQLHRLGFGVDHPHAVKALAEAMAYETALGHAVRLKRGVYGLVPGTPLKVRLPGLLSGLPPAA